MYSLRSTRNFARKKRKSKFRKYIVLACLSLFLSSSVIFFVIAYITGISRFTVSSIRIIGNEVTSANDIEHLVMEDIDGSYLHFFKKRSIFFYPKDVIEEHIIGNWARIVRADVYADTMTSITVHVEERIPFYLWCGEIENSISVDNKDDCYFLDEEGFVFSLAPYFSGSVFFTVYGPLSDTEWSMRNSSEQIIGKRFLAREDFEKMTTLRDAFILLGKKAVSLSVLNDKDRQFTIDDGSRIIFGKDQPVEAFLSNLDSVTEALPTEMEIDYIDLRFGNKVFYKFK